MNTAYKQLLTTLVRWLLTLGSAWMIRKGMISQEDASAWLPEIAGGIVIALGSLGWALWSRIQERVGFLVALRLHEEATQGDVKQVVESLPVAKKITVALKEVEPPSVL